MSAGHDRARRAYRRLLALFPPGFRRRYGAEMEDLFLRHLADARRGGGGLRTAAVWLRAAWDAVVRGGAARLAARSAGRRDGNTGRGGGMGAVAADLRYAVRALVKRPLFTSTAVITLALGIGAATAVFSVVNALLLRPLPYPDPDRLVMVWAENAERGWTETDVNLADAWDWRERAGVFEDLAVFEETGLNLTGGDRPELLEGIEATPNLFATLGVEPALGRGFGPADGREGAPLAVVLTDGAWTRLWGRDPGVLGSTVLLDGEAATVVGVLPAEFRFLDEVVDVFVPYRGDPAAAARGDHDREAVARLLPGTTAAEAERAVDAVAARLAEEHPEQNRGWDAEVETLRDFLLGDIARQASLVLLGAVGFVVLMACVNVANLLLARGRERRAEIAVRSALGAGRGRIVRQLFTESVVLAVAAGAGGLALATWLERAIVAGLPDTMPPVFTFGLDPRVLTFAVVLTVGTAVFFGLLPALRTSAAGAADLREGGRGRAGGSSRFGGFLIVAQTALAVVLLVGGAVLARSVAGMAARDLGFRADGVLLAGVSPPEGRYPDPADLTVFWESVLDRVRGLPGVVEAGTTQSAPLGGSNWAGVLPVQGAEGPAGTEGVTTRLGYVTPGYLEALGVPLLAGRPLARADRSDAPPVALVNRTFVDRYLQGRDPLATTLGTEEDPVAVVGVVGDVVERGLDAAVEPTTYMPAAQRVVRSRTLVVRASGDPLALSDAVQEAVWAVDPAQPVHGISTMEARVDRGLGGFLLIAQLMGGFALLSLLLGAVGIYGVTAQAVGSRTHEIGIRMAMGADRGSVVRMVLGRSLRRALAGLALGTGAALLLTRALTGLLVGVSPTDPVAFGGALAVLLAVGALGSWLPARRASSVDPVRALAAE